MCRLHGPYSCKGRGHGRLHMASVYSLKPRFQKLLRPRAQQLVSKGITANEVTPLAGALSAGTGALLSWHGTPRGWILILPLVLFVRMALNALDGLMARECHQQTRLGACLVSGVRGISYRPDRPVGYALRGQSPGPGDGCAR